MNNETKENDLTLKQRKFIAGYLVGKPMTVAAVEAGYAVSTAARGATELLRSSKVRTAIQESLDQAGVTAECLAQLVREGLVAVKTTYVNHDGAIKPITEADWLVRHKFLETVLRLRGENANQETPLNVETHEQRVMRLRGLVAPSGD